MIELIKIEGIVIGKIDINESDRIVTVFSSSFGKINILVKGIRKSKKREKIGVDILCYSKFVVYKKDDSFVANSVESINLYSEIRKDINKIGIASYIISILNVIINTNERNSIIYDLSLKSFDYLDRENNKEKYNVLLIFFMYKVIQNQGIMFSVEEGNKFSLEHSLISEKNYGDSKELSKEEYFIIKNIYLSNVKIILNRELELKNILGVILIFEKYLNYHLELNLNLKNYILEDAKW